MNADLKHIAFQLIVAHVENRVEASGSAPPEMPSDRPLRSFTVESSRVQSGTVVKLLGDGAMLRLADLPGP